MAPPKSNYSAEPVTIPANGGEPYKYKFQVGTDQLYSAVWSPDSKHILAAKTHEDVWPTTWSILPITGGTPVVAYKREPNAGTPLVWLRDNRIVFSTESEDSTNLWLAKLAPGQGHHTEFLRVSSAVMVHADGGSVHRLLTEVHIRLPSNSPSRSL